MACLNLVPKKKVIQVQNEENINIMFITSNIIIIHGHMFEI